MQEILSDLNFDLDELRKKYKEERDKRIRPEGSSQYQKVEGEFSFYLDDPWVESGFQREPISDDIDVLVVGGGFGGLLTGAYLRKAGIASIRHIERAGDFGGVWYYNRYPGVACDIEAYTYLPLLEEMGYMPPRRFANGAEIFEYAKSIARKFDLYDGALFQTAVSELRWVENSARWLVKTNRGDLINARHVISTSGHFMRPKLPGLPGILDYKGHTFHSSRWDYGYTAGGPDGNLTGLTDKRVGIIGTGASAVQIVPHLGRDAKQLYVFQRTPSSIAVRDDKPTDQQWFKSLKPGWHKERVENFTAVVQGAPVEKDLVNDSWTEIFKNQQGLIVKEKVEGELPEAEMELRQEIADHIRMENIRARVETVIDDPATAEALKPWYRTFCKRPCFHDEFLPTFNRSNVKLVDTGAHGVDRFTETGVVVGGQEYALDCVIFATGFDNASSWFDLVGYDVYGRNGIALRDKWKGGFRSLHGMTVSDFPNYYLVGNGLQQQGGANFTHALAQNGEHAAYIVSEALSKDLRSIEATAAAEEAWVQEVLELSGSNAKFQQECTPSYINGEGKVAAGQTQNSSYGRPSYVFHQILADWRASGEFPGMEIVDKK